MAATAAAVGDLRVPTVTLHDLYAFYTRHFNPSQPVDDCSTSKVAPTPANDDDDGLGYYPDGTKRTLTDAQISIFRHSEIQTLLRQRRRKREEAAENGENEMKIAQVSATDGENVKSKPKPKQIDRVLGKESKSKRRRKNQKLKLKNDRRSKIDGEWTPRRVAREQDEVVQDVGELDYG